MTQDDPRQGPVLCMNRDKQALGFVKKRLASHEPCAVVCIKDFGKDIVYTSLVQELEKKGQKQPLTKIHVTAKPELHQYLQGLREKKSLFWR